jgi:metal-responsive CopG/Arc/MetJ family transcriptional regulator
MKTAISINDELLNETDRVARELRVMRSRLVSIALQSWLRERRQDEMIEQLNRVYSEKPAPGDARTLKNMKRKFRATIKDRW